MNKPIKISAKCITYGRVELLQEALHSFLLQDYEDTELVIVNDCPFQKLHFDHPKVRIFNMDKVFETIGDKENFALEQCKGDVFVVWDDDDIAMPWHLKNVEKYFTPGSTLLHWNNGVFYNEPAITAITGLGNSGIVYSRAAWEAIGKSPIMNAGGDMELVNRIKALDPKKVVYAHPDAKDVSWFYRWSTVNNYHQSGMGTDTPDRDNIIKRNAAFVESLRVRGEVPQGDITLKPNWKFNYQLMLEDYVSRIHNSNVQKG